MIVSTLRHKIQAIASAIAIIAAAMTATSCDSLIYDDLDPCGVKLRFVYDYNMLYANAFPSQVHCLKVLIYDSEGNLVAVRDETDRALLSDEGWAMTIVPEGDAATPFLPGVYTVKAYGGMNCPESSFHFTGSYPLGSAPGELGVAMDTDCYDVTPGGQLHHLFYGEATFEVVERDVEPERIYTVPMMKDTHNIRILLQHLSGEPVESADFTFTLTDAANSIFDGANNLLPVEPFTIYPWIKGNTVPSGLGEPILAFAEFSTSRLMADAPMRLLINHKSAPAGRPTVSIPLVPYLLLLKSEHFGKMTSQEYLDREDYWSVIFFLDENNSWVRTHIVVNNWVVRINEADL